MSDDRRRAERFPMRVPVSFGGGNGTTHDVSGRGVLFETDYPFEVGSEIDFTLVVPDTTNVLCHGTIVRMTQIREHFGVAVQVDSYKLTDDQPVIGVRPHMIIEEFRKHQG